jgi:hypothetical protein
MRTGTAPMLRTVRSCAPPDVRSFSPSTSFRVATLRELETTRAEGAIGNDISARTRFAPYSWVARISPSRVRRE